MPTVSPYYQQRGVANPYYVLDPATVTQTVSADTVCVTVAGSKT